jgi:hypothetical protein
MTYKINSSHGLNCSFRYASKKAGYSTNGNESWLSDAHLDTAQSAYSVSESLVLSRAEASKLAVLRMT